MSEQIETPVAETPSETITLIVPRPDGAADYPDTMTLKPLGPVHKKGTQDVIGFGTEGFGAVAIPGHAYAVKLFIRSNQGGTKMTKGGNAGQVAAVAIALPHGEIRDTYLKGSGSPVVVGLVGLSEEIQVKALRNLL